MANKSLEDHRSLIIHLFRQRYPEEEIAEELCATGIKTTFFEVQQHLETWCVIPCPSPVHSKDADNPGDQQRLDRNDKLGVTCHHGETSHISQTSLANIPCDSTSIEKYQQDIQNHEGFACGFRLPQVEPVIEIPQGLEPDSDTNDYPEGDLLALIKRQRAERALEGRDKSKARLARPMRVRRKNRIQK